MSNCSLSPACLFLNPFYSPEGGLGEVAYKPAKFLLQYVKPLKGCLHPIRDWFGIKGFPDMVGDSLIFLLNGSTLGKSGVCGVSSKILVVVEK